MEELEQEQFDRRVNLWVAIVVAIIMVGMGAFSYIIGYHAGQTSIISTIPETEVVETAAETIVSTTAPEMVTEASIPTTEETIHIEETTIPEAPSEAPSAPVSGETNISVPQTELEMLACVIYQEAGGDAQCDACRYRVADIVLNRVADSRFPNTMYEVLTAESQYGRFHWTGIVWDERVNNPGEKHAVERAYKVAEDVLNGQHSELYGNGYIWQAGFVQGSDGFWCCGHFYGR